MRKASAFFSDNRRSRGHIGCIQLQYGRARVYPCERPKLIEHKSMSADIWSFVIIIGYLIVYCGLSLGGIAWLRWRRKTKWPFKESDKLLRGPGEGLRRRIAQFDEMFVGEYIAAIFVALIGWPIFASIAKLVGLTGWKAFAVIVGGLLLVAVASAWRCMRLWKKRANCYLGWFGERLVAEKLRPLQLNGYRVFHDLPCEPGKNGFNIDHVVVGPSGVTVVEVKTRRKGNARPGFKDHEVSFDGAQLIWPWGEDRHGIQQALNEADWLAKWLFECTGLKLSVRALLALPGWYVHEKPSPTLRVVNPSFLTDAIHGRGEIVLKPREIDLIARQLDQRCRDIED